MSKINTGRIGTRVRFLRSWRGYRVGAIIEPPAALRQALLVQKVLGKPIIEIVQEPAADLRTAVADDPVAETAPTVGNEFKRRRGRPPRNGGAK